MYQKFIVSGHGRKVGAIGIFHGFSCEVIALNADEARIKVYDLYEHISGMSVRPTVAETDAEENTTSWE